MRRGGTRIHGAGSAAHGQGASSRDNRGHCDGYGQPDHDMPELPGTAKRGFMIVLSAGIRASLPNLTPEGNAPYAKITIGSLEGAGIGCRLRELVLRECQSCEPGGEAGPGPGFPPRAEASARSPWSGPGYSWVCAALPLVTVAASFSGRPLTEILSGINADHPTTILATPEAIDPRTGPPGAAPLK